MLAIVIARPWLQNV